MTVVAADWGFGVQIYALSNGTLTVPELFWSWGDQWNIDRLNTYVAARRLPVLVLLRNGPAAVSDAVTADIVGLLAVEDEFRVAGTPEWFLMGDAWFQRKIDRDELLIADDDGIVGYLMWTSLWRLPWIEARSCISSRCCSRWVGSEPMWPWPLVNSR